MQTFAYILISTVDAILMALQIAMFIRAILSWIPGLEENKFSNFLYTVTEPVIMPIRALFDRMGWFQNSPLDAAFFVTYILLAVISTCLTFF